MKQIKIAAKGKLLEEKLQTSEDKFQDQKYLILGRATYLTFQSSRATLVLMSLFNCSFTCWWIVVRAYCSLQNKIETCRLLNNSNSVIFEMEICNLQNGKCVDL